MSRNRFRAAAAVLSVVALAVAMLSMAPGAGAAATTVTFECTGANQTWTVPAGVSSATFDLYGAQGGATGDGVGGLGGRTTATIALTPGEILNIRVGCAGQPGANTPPGGGGGAGGFGGGARGGHRWVGGGVGGGGGGGASDVRRSSGLATRVLVAGGGGGAGYQLAGGAGGGLAGGDGTDAPPDGGPDAADGGGGASGATPGVAGTPGGTVGSLGVGGAGADNPGASSGLAGGGGGGGRAGGGGGGYDPNGWGSGGGGGGSALAPEGATLATGVRAGDGRVVITVPSVPDAPTGVTATPGVETALVTWTPPADDGGAPIVGYEVVANPGGIFFDLGVVTSSRLGGLDDGTTYTFEVRALNTMGFGAAASSNPVTLGFTDVPPGPPAAPFYDDIAWLADSGITGGYDDGTFRPALPVSRQGMAAFLYRMQGSPLGEDPSCTAAPFPDVPTSNPFCGEIDWLVDEGITGGFSDGTFRPAQSISRQSMAGFLYRVAGEPDGTDPPCASAPFPDVPTSNPFCGEIDWLVDEDITGGFPDGTFRPALPVSRQAMAAFLHRGS